jgi:hypothetical protein
MKPIKALVAGAALAVVAGGSVLLANPASAAAPGWEPDANGGGYGTISFYDAAGNQVSGGNNLSHLFDYAVASSNGDPAQFHKANILFAFPDHANPTSSWFAVNASTATNYPVASPASIAAAGTEVPVANPNAGEANLSAALGAGTADTTPGYANVMQIRLVQSGNDLGYWTADISYDTVNHTWSQVYPVLPAATATTTTVSASPASPQLQGTNVTFTGHVVPASGPAPTNGSVKFFDGATQIGTTQPFTGSDVSVSTTTLSVATHSITAQYLPAGIAFAGSTSAPISYKVNGPAAATTTVLSGPTTANVGDTLTIHADVKSGAPATAVPASAGAVQFAVNGTNSGSPVALGTSGANFSYTPSAAGSATITADFVSADTAAYTNSSDTTGVTVVTSAASYNPDPQNTEVGVPAGTLVISTPYTVANPFRLGTMVLNSAGTGYSTSAPFGVPAATAVAATDPGTLGSTALAPAWAQATAYTTGQKVSYLGAIYAASSAHTSGSDFNTDLSAGKWTVSSYGSAATTNGVTITDTRAGSAGWIAYAQTSDFTNPSLSTLIPGDNLTFTGVTPKYLAGNALQAGSVNPHDITGFGPVGGKKRFADTTQGPGTVNISGVMGLTAATSTKPGLYTATVTFTVIDYSATATP